MRQILLEQGLKNNEDNEGQKKDEKKPALGAGFLLRIFEVWQSFIKYLGAKARSLTEELYRSAEAPRHPKSVLRLQIAAAFCITVFPTKFALQPGQNRYEQRDGNGGCGRRPCMRRAKRRSAQRPPWRIPSKSAQIGRPEATGARLPTCSLAALAA